MLSAFILAVIGAGLCLLLALLAKRLLWPALLATLLVGGSITACAWLLFGAIFLRAHGFGLCLPFTYAAAGAAIVALATAWLRRRRIRLGQYADALEQRERTRKKARHVVLIACSLAMLILVAGGAATRIVLVNRVRKEVKEELNDIRAEGFPVTLKDLEASYPQPPPGQNAADPYLKALAVYVDAKGAYKMPPAGERLPQEMKRMMEAYLADNHETLKFLHQAGARPLFRFPVDFTKVCQDPSTRLGLMGWLDIRGSTLVEEWRLCRLLEAEALVHAENGRGTEAAEGTVCMLDVARALGNEPFMTTQTTRIMFQMWALDMLQGTLSRTAISDEDLGGIDDLLKDAVNLGSMTRALAAVRCMGSASFTNRKAGAAFAEIMDESNLHYPHRFGRDLINSLFMAPISWRLRFLGLLDLDHLVFLRWMKTVIADWQEHTCKGGLFEGFWLSEVHPFVNSPAEAFCCNFTTCFVITVPGRTINLPSLICKVKLARTAVAVERYRNAQGGLPSELSELVPAYLPAVPLDPWDKKPLRYKKLDKGYVLYSVGRDGKNDGSSVDSQSQFSNITFRVTR